MPLYLYKEEGGAGTYSWREDRVAPPLHGGMPPPIEGEAEKRRQGVGHPLTEPLRHCLHVVGYGLVLGYSLVGILLG